MSKEATINLTEEEIKKILDDMSRGISQRLKDNPESLHVDLTSDNVDADEEWEFLRASESMQRMRKLASKLSPTIENKVSIGIIEQNIGTTLLSVIKRRQGRGGVERVGFYKEHEPVLVTNQQLEKV